MGPQGNPADPEPLDDPAHLASLEDLVRQGHLASQVNQAGLAPLDDPDSQDSRAGLDSLALPDLLAPLEPLEAASSRAIFNLPPPRRAKGSIFKNLRLPQELQVLEQLEPLEPLEQL